MPEREYQIEMLGIRKSFGRATALFDVNFFVRRGETHAMFGADGSGKSTLVNILSGRCLPDSGEIMVGGRGAEIASPADSIKNGISSVCGESGIVPMLSVAENIFLDELHGKPGFHNPRGMNIRAEALLKDAGLEHIDAASPASRLDAASLQIIEICRAMARGSSTLLLDDPAAEISMRDTERLFRLIGRLKERGLSVVCALERIEDALAVSDRITALREGLSSEGVDASSAAALELAGTAADGGMMPFFPSRSVKTGKPLITVEHARAGGAASDVSFEAREGEVLGLVGLACDGRAEAIRALLGGGTLDGGTLKLSGRELRIKSPDELGALGVAFLPEEYGWHGPASGAGEYAGESVGARVRDFFTGALDDIKKELRGGIGTVAGRRAGAAAADAAREKGRDAEIRARGDRRKAALAAIDALSASVLVLDEPARGLSAEAKLEIYAMISAMAEKRRAVILISSELNDIAGICDRAVVVRKGRSVGELKRGELSKANILRRASDVY